MRKGVVFLLILLISILPVFLGCSHQGQNRAQDLEQVSKEERIVIKFSHVVAETTPKGMAARRFANLVKDRTGGRVEVQVYPNSVLFKDGEEMLALYEGQVQMIAPATAKVAERFPLWQLFDLPFLFRSEREVHSLIDGEVGRQLMNVLEPHRIKAMAVWDNGFKQIITTVPLESLQDLYGTRFRVMPGSKVLEGQIRNLKAIPVPLPFNEVYGALEAGRVQATENTASNIYTKKFFEVHPYLTISNHGYLGYVVLVNGDFWDHLPLEIRLILEDTLAEVTIWQREIAASQNAADLAAMIDSGQVEITELATGEKIRWMEMMAPVYRDFENLGGKSLLARAKLALGLGEIHPMPEFDEW